MEQVQRLFQSLEAIPGAQRADSATAPVGKNVALGTVDAIDLMAFLRLRMQRQLFLHQREAAWNTVQIGIRLCQFLQERIQTFYDITVAGVAQKQWLLAVLAAIDADQWSTAELRELTTAPDLTGVSRRLRDALSTEWSFFERSAEQATGGVSWLKRHIVYQPNRTQRAWLDAAAPFIAALDADHLAQAHQALLDSQSSVKRNEVPFRNALGFRLAEVSLAGISTPVAQAIDLTARLRLVKLRAALALYKLDQGRWPPDLAALSGTFIPRVPEDPWSTSAAPLRYSVSNRRIYSIGQNKRDDQGRFVATFAHPSGSDDYGIQLPE